MQFISQVKREIKAILIRCATDNLPFDDVWPMICELYDIVDKVNGDKRESAQNWYRQIRFQYRKHSK